MTTVEGVEKSGRVRRLSQSLYAIVLAAISAALIWMGARLVGLGGSAYYLIAGLVLLGAALLLWRRDPRGALVYAVLLAGTYGWALWEVGLNGWALAPRVVVPTALGLWLLTPWAYDPSAARASRRFRVSLASFAAIGLMVGAGALVSPEDQGKSAARPALAGGEAPADWASWGNDAGGQRFSKLAQITPANVGELKPAWTFRSGEPGLAEVTPLQIRDTLYLCDEHNNVMALDAETGRQRWRANLHADPDQVLLQVCRGVAYYRDPSSARGPCAERIITATIDARLVALDATDGQRCPMFGKNGSVDLLDGMGDVEKGYYHVTSAPQIANGNIILGGWVYDNQQVQEPSGVVRAFDAVTGKFVWAFDVGRPGYRGEPKPGETYTRGTPNSWAPMSADETLGLIYLPTGNATPDWFGGQRRSFDDAFSSSVVALDARTGAVRWSFQTTHHDLWDYDVPAQPTLYDMPTRQGRVPAVIQATKRGEIFVLDRRTGVPITPVEERPVPASHVPGERAARTQPYSIGMPRFAGPILTEKSMWGMTPLDQLWCRVAFRQARYEGPMTPAGLGRETIVFPGYEGGIDWGGIAVDAERDIMIVNSNGVALRARLIPRAEADRLGIAPRSRKHPGSYALAAQAGTPYALSVTPFLGPLMTPCQQPPYGEISAVDMRTRKLLWTQPFGTARDNGPLGLPSMLPIRMGVPNTGGAVVTRGGLTFIGATSDRYLRAFETSTGRQLWQARLPAGGQATPMTYRSPRSGRQFVVIAAGGHGVLMTKRGDYLLAYALPQTQR